MLGKLPVPGRPTNLEYSRARAYCACSRFGWRLFGHFYAPEGTSGGISKSHRQSVRTSVTNRVSAISHKLLKQL